MDLYEHDDFYYKKLCRSLMEFKANSDYCDVVLNVDGTEFKAHKLILSANSPYFQTMFNGRFPESSDKTIALHGVEADAFACVLHYMYSGDLKLNKDIAIYVLQAVDFLQLDWLKTQCRRYLRQMINLENCLTLIKLADLYTLPEIMTDALKFAVWHMDEISKTHDFLALDTADVLTLLNIDKPTQIQSEMTFAAAIRWVKHDPDIRVGHLGKLLNFVRTNHISPIFLEAVILKESLLRKDVLAVNWLLDNFALVQHNYGPNRKTIAAEADLPVAAEDKNIFIMDTNNDFYSFNAKTTELSRLGSHPPSQGFSPVSYKKSVYLFGGKRTRTAVKYHIERNEWDMFTFRCYFSSQASTILHDSVFFTGGFKRESWHNAVYRYDFNTDKIYKRPGMLMKRSLHGCTSQDNSVYVCGGTNITAHRINELSIAESMDIREGTWHLLPAMRRAHGDCSAAIISDTIYCTSSFGGRTERFDLRQRTWEEVTSAPGEIGTIVSYDNKLYRIYSSGIAEYHVSTDEWYHILDFAFDRPMAIAAHF